MEAFLLYAPVLVVSAFLNFADIYFLQLDPVPRLHRALSFWLYLAGHSLISLGAAFLLYTKANMPAADWPIVTMIASLSGFSLLQSLTLKFGDKGIDARDLFDSWKQRVIADVSQSNASKKRARQLAAAQSLARIAAQHPAELDAAIRQVAGQDAQRILDDLAAAGSTAAYLKAQWLASSDLELAVNLLKMLEEPPKLP